jgi:hypothetical protein
MRKKLNLSTSNRLLDFLLEPVSLIDDNFKVQPVASKKAKRKANSKKKPETGQAYLPGLSRRGRPRSKNPIAPVARAMASRTKRLATGAKRIELMVDADIAEKLDALAVHFRESRTDVVCRLIRIAAKRAACVS